MHKIKFKSVYSIFLSAFCLFTNLVYSQETITIDANIKLDSDIKFMQGFLHGNPKNIDSSLTAALQPAFWRIGAYSLAGSSYEDAIKFNSQITININDYYMILNNISSQTLSKPWLDNWANWDKTVSLLALNSKNSNSKISYWDVWGEPDNFWTGSYSQWIETYRRTDSILNSILINPLMIGPEFGFGTCNFNSSAILKFADSLKSKGVIIDGLSWHEMCSPNDVLKHVETIRDSIKSRTWLSNVKILIPEYAGPNNSTIPGWNVGWLYYFEKSKVDWVSHACWDENDNQTTWSNCEFGLNGLFMKDNKTPQPNYWVHYNYTKLGKKRVITNSNVSQTVALCGLDSSKKSINILTGRYYNTSLGKHDAPAEVKFKIENYPYCSNCLTSINTKKIPSNNVPYSVPLKATIDSVYGYALVTNNSFTFTVKNFIDGDAYYISISPIKDSLLDNVNTIKKNTAFAIQPNPASEILKISLTDEINCNFKVYNTLGILCKDFSISKSTDINISDLQSGVYIIFDSNSSNKVIRFIKY